MMSSKFVSRLKRLGVAGFIFFLVKGLIWLAVFYYFGSEVAD